MLQRLQSGIVHRLKLLRERIPYLRCKASEELIVVTGADASHEKSLFQFINSISYPSENIVLVVYDLGLSEDAISDIKKNSKLIYRRFAYENYPDYFNIRVNAGEYAWKPVIVKSVMEEFHAPVCWMDAGNYMLDKSFFWIRKFIAGNGFYSPVIEQRIGDKTHPVTLKNLQAGEDISCQKSLSGFCIAADYENVTSRELIFNWGDLAVKKDYIAPEGSSRKNHRQDQSLISILAYQSGLTKSMPTMCHGFIFHRDID